ncbi:unnamed protein product [Notodromas monacha]|uniref:Uncharacterized protein n=1 Tax=Notodromas monacha TaxID=399045 RepID=A0A7R9BMB0_9CRUS|nr:unnamed protein product [Notodromas monacha]CAG0916769.1 unnamed protein product [Notodromas monacha]
MRQQICFQWEMLWDRGTIPLSSTLESGTMQQLRMKEKNPFVAHMNETRSIKMETLPYSILFLLSQKLCQENGKTPEMTVELDERNHCNDQVADPHSWFPSKNAKPSKESQPGFGGKHLFKLSNNGKDKLPQRQFSDQTDVRGSPLKHYELKQLDKGGNVQRRAKQMEQLGLMQTGPGRESYKELSERERFPGLDKDSARLSHHLSMSHLSAVPSSHNNSRGNVQRRAKQMEQLGLMQSGPGRESYKELSERERFPGLDKDSARLSHHLSMSHLSAVPSSHNNSRSRSLNATYVM